jgi:hypothetical protein
MRLALFISKKHRRSRHFGWRITLVSSPGDLGAVRPGACARRRVGCEHGSQEGEPGRLAGVPD